VPLSNVYENAAYVNNLNYDNIKLFKFIINLSQNISYSFLWEPDWFSLPLNVN